MRKKAAPPAPTPYASAALPVVPAPRPSGAEADVALQELHLSARVVHWTQRSGITTLRELARIAPATLRGQRNLGRRSIAEMRAAVVEHLGIPWESFAAGRDAEDAPAADATDAEEDDAPPHPVPDVALGELALPTRLRNWVHRKGLSTLRELARIAPDDLLAEDNMGRLTVAQTRAVIEPLLGWPWERAAGVPDPVRARREAIAAAALRLAQQQEALAGTPLLDAWRSRLLELGERERAVLIAQAGLDGPAQSQRAIAGRLGIPVGTTCTIERRAVARVQRARGWLAGVRARAEAALSSHGGAAALSTLAEDPWWTGIAALPDALDYFGRRVLEGAWRVVCLEERAYLARCAQVVLDDARQALHAGAPRVSLPAPLATFRALLDPWAPRLHPALTEALFEQLRPHLLVDDDADGVPQVTARTTGREASLLAALRASPVPLRVKEKPQGSMWARMPGEVLRLGPGVLGLPRHFPSYEMWRERLVPAAIRIMEGGPPGRQWQARELHRRLVREVEIPIWLTEWHLGSLLIRSGKVRGLGHMKLALPGVPEGQGRVTVGAELVRILRANGGPMMYRALAEALLVRTGASPEAIIQGLQQALIVRLDRSCYGLVERDLPGRAKARAKAVTHVVALLEQRGRGLAAGPLQEALAGLSPAHARWTPAMCLSALHGDPRLVQSASGAVGLSCWKGVRLPSREDVARDSLKKGRGRVRLATLKRRIEEIYGAPPSQQQLWALAGNLGASVGGGWLTAVRPL